MTFHPCFFKVPTLFGGIGNKNIPTTRYLTNTNMNVNIRSDNLPVVNSDLFYSPLQILKKKNYTLK